jgi:hypothetical protein
MRPVKEISITFEPGNSYALATMTETVYDTNGSSDPEYFSSLNVKQTKEYAYLAISAATASDASLTPATAAGWFASSNPVRVAERDYLYDQNYKARNITDLVVETRVKDGTSGLIRSKSQTSYDEANHTEISSGSMPQTAGNSWLNPVDELGLSVGSKRGLSTTVKRYYDVANGLYVQTENFYDQFGNIRKERDGRGNDTWTAYAADYAFAYPTSVTTPAPGTSETLRFHNAIYDDIYIRL